MKITKTKLKQIIKELNAGSHPEGANDPLKLCANIDKDMDRSQKRQQCWDMAGYKDNQAGINRSKHVENLYQLMASQKGMPGWGQGDIEAYKRGWQEAESKYEDYPAPPMQESKLKITKQKLKQIIKEELEKTLKENALRFDPHDSNTFPKDLAWFVAKHARADEGSINDNVDAARADPAFKTLFAKHGIAEEMLVDIIEAYHDKMGGLY
jgi:hypothetical protein